MDKLFIILIGILGGVWYFKSTIPKERNDKITYSKGEGVWWDTTLLSNVRTDPGWFLDPEIPVNYVPVIGMEETYMVLNNDGTLNRYRKRVKDDNGSWVWEDIIEDDIPVTFVPFNIDDDIYSYMSEDNGKELYKYIRNCDDSYAFVKVDESGEFIEYERPKGENIPENFVLADGNVYAALDDHGVIIAFWEKNTDELGAASWQEIHRDYQDRRLEVSSPYNTSNSHNSDLSMPELTTETQSADKIPTMQKTAEHTEKEEVPDWLELSEGQT